ncbi:MAG: hypothetical protein SOX90_09650, partial [Candidatus Fimadaptatus sp.]|nr:hypothetical protein [Candidatus Fimadaptatus sp.]
SSGSSPPTTFTLQLSIMTVILSASLSIDLPCLLLYTRCAHSQTLFAAAIRDFRRLDHIAVREYCRTL